MADSNDTWEFLFRCGTYGHKFFRHRPSGRVAAADNSGYFPDQTEDGILWVDHDRVANIDADSVSIPVTQDSGGQYWILDRLAPGLEAVRTLGLGSTVNKSLSGLLSALSGAELRSPDGTSYSVTKAAR